MDAVIYYFSGTGNSFIVARDISSRINAELKPVAAHLHSDTIYIPSKVLGFVFPDYHSSLPNIIKGFINKIGSLSGKYVFGVCTYGGAGPGLTIRYLKKLIESREGKLAAGFAVKMPYNYITPSFKKLTLIMTLKHVPQQLQQKMFTDWNKKLIEIVDFINKRKTGIYETSGELLLRTIDAIKLKDSLGKFFWLKMAGYKESPPLSFSGSWRFMDSGFYADENCINCRTCEKMCPVNNIKMKKKKPVWQHNCEQCFACLQWCPKQAIQFGEHTIGNKRYRHPDVKAADLMI